MSRHRSAGSTHHHIKRERSDEFVLSWVVDHYYAGQRGRYPCSYTRHTDRRGAERFAKKWHIKMPEGS